MRTIIQAQPGWVGLCQTDEGIWFSGTVIAWGVANDDIDDVVACTEFGECEFVVSPANVVTWLGCQRWATIKSFLDEKSEVVSETKVMLLRREAAE